MHNIELFLTGFTALFLLLLAIFFNDNNAPNRICKVILIVLSFFNALFFLVLYGFVVIPV